MHRPQLWDALTSSPRAGHDWGCGHVRGAGVRVPGSCTNRGNSGPGFSVDWEVLVCVSDLSPSPVWEDASWGSTNRVPEAEPCYLSVQCEGETGPRAPPWGRALSAPASSPGPCTELPGRLLLGLWSLCTQP